jgi:lipopolysaccharide transport system ATP-binding protein
MNAIEELCTQALLLDRGQVRDINDDVRSVTRQYLYTGSGVTSAEWTNSGSEFENPWFTPKRLFIGDRQGKLQSMPLSNNEEHWIHIEGAIKQLDSALTIGCAIYTEDNRLLYWSYQTDQEEGKWPRLKKGAFLLYSKLPNRLLNEGTYRVELIGGLHHRQWLFEPNTGVPSITLTIKGGLSDSALWLEKRPGILAPNIEWYGTDEVN